jgi:hypothetical protein
MNPRKTARIVGVLFIIATVAGILSVVFTGPLNVRQEIYPSNYLININANASKIITGTVLVLIMGVAVLPIPAMLFPILKKHNEDLAIGYVVFRVVEGATYVGTMLSMLLLVTLSKEFVLAGAPVDSYYRTLDWLLSEAGVWINHIRIIIFSISALILNYIFYRSKLLPRWLSGFGLVAGVLHLAEGLLGMLGLLSAMSTLGNLLMFPIFLQEMVYAVWLIAKGFNSSAIASESAKTDIN